jgi:hypothetical protein
MLNVRRLFLVRVYSHEDDAAIGVDLIAVHKPKIRIQINHNILPIRGKITFFSN